jgi:centromeric protein E
LLLVVAVAVAPVVVKKGFKVRLIFSVALLVWAIPHSHPVFLFVILLCCFFIHSFIYLFIHSVAIRMRPLNQNEGNYQRVWKVMPQYHSIAQIALGSSSSNNKNQEQQQQRVTGRNYFTFDKTFGEDVSTKQVYDSVAKNIVTSVVSGLNGTIFAYGQTSSGKTYTMQGAGTIAEGCSSGSSGIDSGGGIVHMAAADIFRLIHKEQDHRVFLVRASFLEIYNEEVRDLLAPDTRVLPIREDPRKGVFVQSEEHVVTDFAALLQILFTGEKSRKFAATDMNERSSRSHTIFRITIESHAKKSTTSTATSSTAAETAKSSGSMAGSDDDDDDENGNSDNDGAVLISTLNLVDLAGSESVRHTGARGERQKEGGMINQRYVTLECTYDDRLDDRVY